MVNRNGLMKRRWEQASYTVEAAFVVPLGFLVLMSLSCLFTGAVKQNNVQMALLKTVQAYGTTQSRTSALQGIADQKVLIRWEEQSLSVPIIIREFRFLAHDCLDCTGTSRWQRLIIPVSAWFRMRREIILFISQRMDGYTIWTASVLICDRGSGRIRCSY